MGLWWWVLTSVLLLAFALAVLGLLGLGLWRKVKKLTTELSRLTTTLESAGDAMRPAGANPAGRWEGEPGSDEWTAAAARPHEA